MHSSHTVLFACSFQNFAKRVKAVWEGFSAEVDIPLVKMGGNISRRLAVSVSREEGANSEARVHLAKHMAHSTATADKHYDRAGMTTERREAQSTITSNYEKVIPD
jgi:hypothetical protein